MTIVVGVDGSDDAHRALRFAIDEAKLRTAPLRVICAWEPSIDSWAEMPPPEQSLDRQRAAEVVADSAAVVERLAPNVECECLALEGVAGDVLLQQSADASLVVVGRRGHRVADMLGSVADVLLGSVSAHVVRDAHCPVAVVPHSSSRE
jgi:nucleotide-binding universal stress UspA family protein